MSRNFELLQQFGKEQEIFAPPTPVRTGEPDVFAEPESFVSSPSQLENAGTEEVKT
jgi:hypothetical protein